MKHRFVFCMVFCMLMTNVSITLAQPDPEIDPGIDLSLQSKIQVLTILDSPSILEGANEKQIQDLHNHFLNWLEYRKITFHDSYSLSHIVNGLVLKVNSSDIALIKNYSMLKRILLLESSFYPSRGISRGHIAVEKDRAPIPWTGKGIRIGLIDTGINPQHPELKNRVTGGANFVRPGEGYDDRSFHGTFLAGVIGGTGIDEIQKGIAPEVEFRSYVVIDRLNTPPVSILPALDQAVRDECKIVVLPISGESSDSEVLLQALAIMRKANIAIITAAGNNGMPLHNSKTIDLPGSSPDVLTIGASDDRRIQWMELQAPQGAPIKLSSLLSRPSLHFSSSLSGLELVEAGYGSKREFDRLFSSKPAPYIALIHRGPANDPLTFNEKMINARNAGAKAVIFINYPAQESIQAMVSPQKVDIYWHKEYLPSCMVDYTDIQELLEDASSWSTHFEDQIVAYPDYWTSNGPVPGNLVKPDLLAPGSFIFSIINLGYGWMDGSSISAGFVAGATACLMQAHPNWSIDQIFSSLVHTATPLHNPPTGHLFSNYLQGAGEINLLRALETPLHLSPLSLRIAYEKESQNHTISVENSSSHPVSVEILPEIRLEMPDLPSVFSIECSPSRLDLGAGQKAEIALRIHLDTQALLFNQYEARIKIGALHFPLIVEIPESLKSNVPIEHFNVHPLRWDAKEIFNTKSIDISFFLNSGSRYRGRDYDLVMNQALVDIVLIDKNGLHWANCFSGYLYPDYYHIQLKHGFKDRHSFPPDGTYYLTIQHWGLDNLNRTARYQQRIPVEIYHSPETAVDIYWKAYRKQALHERFKVSLVASEDLKLKRFIIEFRFNPRLLSCQSIEILSLRGLEGCQPELTRIGSNADGLIFVEWNCPDNRSIQIPRGTALLELGFVGMGKGNAEVSVSKLYGLNEEGVYQTYRFYGFSCHITEAPLLHGDLNNDGHVDEKDKLILDLSFGLHYRDSSFNFVADINGDGKVDGIDLSIMAKDFLP